jgi:hypothetical protein
MRGYDQSSAMPAVTSSRAPGRSLPHPLLRLQATAGNIAVAGMLERTRTAGNEAANALTAAPRLPLQRCGCGGASTTDDHDMSVQRFGLGFVGDLLTAAGDLLGGEAEPLDQKAGPGTCSEQPTWESDTPVPTDIRADSALEFVNKMKAALGGSPHMEPSFTWSPEANDKGRITKVNMKIKTKIIRPRFAGGRMSDAERALVNKVEALIKAHEERHREIAKTYAQRAVCAAIGKESTSKDPSQEAPYVKAMKTVMCEMNKAQEALDHKEGTLRWTLADGGTGVTDVNLAPEPGAKYPCT